MPPNRRFTGTIHCHVPEKVGRGIQKLIDNSELTKSEAVRDLLKEGLKARGIEC